MHKKNQLAARLGEKIRALRRTKKMTLIELAHFTGIAQATLSRMETGLMVGTVKSHQKIAETLGISLPELYGQIDSRYDQTRFHSAQTPRKITVKTDQMKCELLTQEISKKKITPLLITLSGQGKTNQEQLERGVEKFLYVLEGSVKVLLNKEEFPLKAEDTLYFDGSIPHSMTNASSKTARIFCAVSPSKI